MDAPPANLMQAGTMTAGGVIRRARTANRASACIHLNSSPESSMNRPIIRVIRPEQFDRSTAQTPGSQRSAAVHPASETGSPLWGGLFTVDPGARTGIHHHGQQHTLVYVLSGSSVVRWGDTGEESATAEAGDFLSIPAWIPHQEINPSDDLPFQWVVVRSTSEPIVVNLPDSHWERPHDG